MPSPRPAGWDLHDRALRALLTRLDPDPATAGEKYEQLRRGLVRVFDWRGVRTPDVCADETIDRVARKLDDGVAVDDVIRFAYGVARLVLLEQGRRPEARETSLDEAIAASLASPPDDIEEPEGRRQACFERCLATLGADARALILRYYVAANRDRIASRAMLAAELGLSQNALRSRAQRIRNQLERCTNACTGARSRNEEP